MEILAGVILTLFVEALAWLGVRAWRKNTAPLPPPQPPRSGAQRQNEAAHLAHLTAHPVVRSSRVVRRRPRGRARFKTEETE